MEKEKRVELLFLMLETVILVGISTALIAATSFENMEDVQIIPLACALLGAAVLCLLDSFAVRKAADRAWIITEEIHQGWHEAQVRYAETGQESYKQ